MDTAAGSAKSDGGDYMIVPSRSQDPKKNLWMLTVKSK